MKMGYRIFLAKCDASTGYKQQWYVVLKNFKRIPLEYDNPKGSFYKLSNAWRVARKVRYKKNIFSFVKIHGPKGGEYRITHNGVKRI